MMMAEYIEREAAIREMYKEPSYYDPVNILTEVRDRIKAIPAADVRPVGKWIEVAMRIKCSVCGTDFNDEVTCCSDCYRWPWNYCPSCGAKMKGE